MSCIINLVGNMPVEIQKQIFQHLDYNDYLRYYLAYPNDTKIFSHEEMLNMFPEYVEQYVKNKRIRHIITYSTETGNYKHIKSKIDKMLQSPYNGNQEKYYRLLNSCERCGLQYVYHICYFMPNNHLFYLDGFILNLADVCPLEKWYCTICEYDPMDLCTDFHEHNIYYSK